MSITDNTSRLADDLEARFSKTCIVRALVTRLYVKEVFGTDLDFATFCTDLIDDCMAWQKTARLVNQGRRLDRFLARLDAGEPITKPRRRKKSPRKKTPAF